MYLSRIELHGFKSFADKTAVHFDPGVTAIVGPNGCGKSNIIDAVRWVLGEQRARLLRSEKMESIIFNGTATRRALGLAEVSLTVENTRNVLPTEYTDVTISRRLYRSGESEYLLNGTVCRLKDILDLFMDTGMGPGAYSVIELKMIEDILSENAADRRRLFEEAAGITKYKLRRSQALRRLDTTQADLTRLADLTDEIEKQVRSLSRQAHKAQRHQTFQQRLRALELGLAASDYERLETERKTLDADAARLRDQVDERTTQLQAREAESEAQRAALLDRERELSEAQTALNAHVEQIRQAEAEARLAEARATAAAAALDRLDRERDADAARAEGLRDEAKGLNEQIEAAERDRREAEARQAGAAGARDAAQSESEKARTRLGTAREAARIAEEAVAEARAALESLRSRRLVLDEEIARVEMAQAENEHRLGEAEERKTTTATRRAEAEARRDDTDRVVREMEAARAELGTKLEAAQQELREAQRRHDASAAEAGVLQSLLDSYEGFSDAVQILLDEPDWAHEPKTVTDVIACDPELRPAVHAALGPFADCLVVRDEAEAQAGIGRLRDEDAGRATFIVLDRLPDRAHPVLSPTPPGTRAAVAVVRADQQYQKLVKLLLQNYFIADTLEEAKTLRDQYAVARFVTPSGEWTSARGVTHAGGADQSATAERIGRREQLEAAQAQQAAMQTVIGAAEEEVRRLHSARDALELDARRADLREAERLLNVAGREAAQVAYEVEAQTNRRVELKDRLDDLRRQREEAESTTALDRALADAQTAYAKAQEVRTAAEAQSDTTEAALRDALARYAEVHLEVVQAQGRAEALRRDRDRAERTVAEIALREDERLAEADRVRTGGVEASNRKDEQTARADTLRTAKADLDAAVQAAENAVLEGRAAISDTDVLLRDLRRLREDAQQHRGAGEIRLTEIGTRMEAVVERVWDEYGVALGELDAPDPDFDTEAARAETPKLREQLRGIGAVNELALESYEEEKKRLDFLREQQADLEQAEASLRDTIKEINTTASARFDETFEAVRREFQRLFKELFGENATADIVLLGDDPLDDAIEIRARPKGKKPSAITQLSGGEKTLTAIALLFAIYLVKPSPFCILDEVDAPLDDSNVERFMSLIRVFSESTQFILVTHNKLTMEAADRMYGVTMQEEGVSKLVGVRFDEVLPEAA